MDWEPTVTATASCSNSSSSSSSSSSAGGSTSTLPSVLVGFSNQERSGKILPCTSVKEDGLMRIEPSTLHDVLQGAYSSKISTLHLIDCRFDYEFNGGHIDRAINITKEAELDAHLLADHLPLPSISGLPDATGQAKKTVVIFHCEFSQKRGPELAKLLRKKDRAANQKSYPALYYPELYILEGGYCHFFRRVPHLCTPQAYVSMDDPAHVAKRSSEIHTMRKFHRAQSWQGSRTAPISLPARPPLRPQSSIARAPSSLCPPPPPPPPSQPLASAKGFEPPAAEPMDDHEDENTFADSSFADSSFEDSFGEGSPARPSSRQGGGGGGGMLAMLGGAKGSVHLQPPPRLNRLERAASSAPQAFTLGPAPARTFARAQSWQPSRPPLAGLFPLAVSAASTARGRRRAGSIIGEEDGA